ncbi:MAG: barstar family protein [Candidatus Parcubacteria bacterium]|nr:barstar family protein [Burkholderiales bacterium]
MSKLLQRLSDASRSGVYRTSRTDEILSASKGSTLQVTCIDLAGAAGSDALMEKLAGALAFPSWFGGNWDALEDCLTDLSWSRASGHVLLLEGAAALPEDDRGILADILVSAASWWKERGRPFFAVFVDGPAALPELYRGRR